MALNFFSLGQRIQAQRKALRLTQEDLAEAISVTVGYVSQIERGITKVNLETLSKIAEFMHCDMTTFLSGLTQNSNEYLADDFKAVFEKLNSGNRKIILEVADVLLKNQRE